MYRGVFWIIEDELFAFPFMEGVNIGISKSGVTYNHKKLWLHVKPRGCNKPYNYYPRGRVDFTNKGIAVIYMNQNVAKSLISEIMVQFELTNYPKIIYDNSNHYKCYLDDGWKSDNS